MGSHADRAGQIPNGSAEGRRQRRKRSFPSPVVILTGLLVLVWIAAFFIPSGQYALDAAGSPIAGSFRFVPAPLDFGGRVRDLLLAPVNGMYGIQDPETGMVGPSNRGKLFGSVEVFLFILSIGGFMSVVFATGALERGIHHLSYRFRERGSLLVAILTLLFCVLGSIKGWSDESLGLYAIMVPLMIALGYDRLVTVAVLTVAPFVGAAAATINPFNIGIAASKAGVSIADRLGLRFTLLVLSVAATVAYTLWYARRVKADPAKSLCGIGADEAALAQADSRPPEPLTGTHVGRDRPRGVHFRAPDLRDHSLGRTPRQRCGRPRHGDDDPVAAVVGARVVAAGTHRPVFRHDHRGRDGRPPRSGGARQSLPQGRGRIRRVRPFS